MESMGNVSGRIAEECKGKDGGSAECNGKAVKRKEMQSIGDGRGTEGSYWQKIGKALQRHGEAMQRKASARFSDGVYCNASVSGRGRGLSPRLRVSA